MFPKFGPHYQYYDKYLELLALIRSCSPAGLVEEQGKVVIRTFPDWRLNWHKYRVIGVQPLERRIAVLLEFRRIMRSQHLYENDPRFSAVEDAYGFLVANRNGLWNVTNDTDLQDGYAETFLTDGMSLMVDELRRIHNQT